MGEQNAEYEASLAADRQREELRAAERQGAEAAERDRQEEEERARWGFVVLNLMVPL